jgi:hypothetical protein
MTMKDQQFFINLLIIGAALYLISNPRCGAGCQTLLQHLLSHELSII